MKNNYIVLGHHNMSNHIKGAQHQKKLKNIVLEFSMQYLKETLFSSGVFPNYTQEIDSDLYLSIG